MNIIIYIIISVVMFFIGVAATSNSNQMFGEEKNCILNGILFAVFWPLAIIFLFLSLFYGVGKYL